MKFTFTISIVSVLACVLMTAARPDSLNVDSTNVRGARGMVPCSDGSIVGGYINCPTLRPDWYISDYCSRPVLTRSWDGGKTWVAEEVDAPDHAPSGIVRLRGGDLLTAHNKWEYGLMRSTDNGRTWKPIFDTTTARKIWGVGEVIWKLSRDSRGILYWTFGGGLHASLDNGKTFILFGDSEQRFGYFVLPPDGLLVTHGVETGSASGWINMSFNHGRSWSKTLKGYISNSFWDDSASTLTGAVVIRDTVVVNDWFGYYSNGFFDSHSRTMYWHGQERGWRSGRYLYPFGTHGVFDSTECWYHYGTAVAPEDTIQRYVTFDIPADSIPPEGDTIVYTRGRLDGEFYDLDGNIHPMGTDVYVPRRAPRPVSRLDRLYTCTGVEYVVGGHNLVVVTLDSARSFNARLYYTITPNRRLSTFVVDAIDPTRPMRFTAQVDDSIVGRQWFTDSVMPLTQKPVVSADKYRGVPILKCIYPDGPFMWYFNDTLLPDKSYGMNADSVISKPKPGTYKVVARSPFGCDVESNEVVVTTTSVDETSTTTPTYKVWYNGDGVIHVEWDTQYQVPRSIVLTDAIGRTINTMFSHGEGQARINVEQIIGVVFVTVENSGMRRTYGVVCMP